MDRGQALEQARTLAAQHRLGPAGFRQRATFGGDEEVQTYVELEAGGKDAFARMIRDGRYAPYTWRVRHFREHDPNETWVRFTPEGVAYGFVERLPETAPGARLAPADARGVAERGAASWQIALSDNALVEQAQEEKPGRRIDHTLVYERPDRLGDGRFRLRLVVAGDRLVEVTPFVRVPEAFGGGTSRCARPTRRSGSLPASRCSCSTESAASSSACSCSCASGGSSGAPRWPGADRLGPAGAGHAQRMAPRVAAVRPAPSTTTFLVQQGTALTAGAVAMTVVFTLSFMAAESLSRRAFPEHPQLWHVWVPSAGASRAVLGRTLGAYLRVATFFAVRGGAGPGRFTLARVVDALRCAGDPDVLATYLPWLSAIAPSVQAGFWEECLFRAVPLAGAALIGDRFGGGGPSSRSDDLTGHRVRRGARAVSQSAGLRASGGIDLPSLLFGALYLRFGLLPGIVLHIAFDVVWFALPLFVSRAPGILIDRTLVVMLALVPLWIVLWRRWQVGAGPSCPRTS